MAPSESIARLGGWVGYGVEDNCLEDHAGIRWCVIRLQLEPDRPRCCDGCGVWVSAIHDVVERRVRHLPIFEHPVELVDSLKLTIVRSGHGSLAALNLVSRVNLDFFSRAQDDGSTHGS